MVSARRLRRAPEIAAWRFTQFCLSLWARRRSAPLALAGGALAGGAALRAGIARGRGGVLPLAGAAAATAAVYAWISFRRLSALLAPRKLLIAYHHRAGEGSGHRAMAENLAEHLDREGVAVDLYNSRLRDKWRAVRRRDRYWGKMHTGWNEELVSLLPDAVEVTPLTRFRTDFSPAMDAGDLMPFAPEDVAPFDRRDVRRLLLELGIAVGDRKLVTLSAGGSGSGLEWRARHLLAALDGRDDWVLVILTGERGRGAPDDDELRRAVGERARVHLLGHLERAVFNRILAQSDLNVGYPGSNSLTDQLAYRNPNIVLGLCSRPLSSDNLEWARRHYGLPAFNLADAASRRAFHRTVAETLDDPAAAAALRGAHAARYARTAAAANAQFIAHVSALHRSKVRADAAAGRALRRRARAAMLLSAALATGLLLGLCALDRVPRGG